MRLKYFIKSGLQIKFLRINILLTIFISLAAAFSVYQLSMDILGPNLEDVYPPGMLKQIYITLGNAFTFRILVIIAIVIIATFFITHSVAGPAYHIERDLTEMAKGDLTKRIYLRKHDELKSIASKLNKMADYITQNLGSIEKNLESMEKLCENLKNGSSDLTRSPDVSDKFTASLKNIKDTLSKFQFKQ